MAECSSQYPTFDPYESIKEDDDSNRTENSANHTADNRTDDSPGYDHIPLAKSASSESGYDDSDGAPPNNSPEEFEESPSKDKSFNKKTITNSEDIYAVIDKSQRSPSKAIQGLHEELPTGWKKCFDEDGAYYWHVRSGRIQRDIPKANEGDLEVLSPAEHLRSMESSLLNLAEKRIKSLSLNEDKPATVGIEQVIKFSVQSIGWVPLAESDLKDQETSSRSINRCILDLTSGKSNEGLGHYTEGKGLTMEINGKELCLVDPISLAILSIQPIHTIRVWGTGSQNNMDFAYVARDPGTRIHRCHVFRCDVPAKHIADTLKEICSRLAKDRKSNTANSLEKADRSKLMALQLVAEKGKVVLPSPMNGPSKTKKCHYLGSTEVAKASGMDIVNAAIDKVCNSTEKNRWTSTNVTVSPAVIRVSDVQDDSDVKLEIRLRFLSFFCISSTDVRLMGMVIHTADEKFVTHVFHCEPSAGALCKIIEAACKLRYQKLLDSMPENSAPEPKPSPSNTNKGIQTVKNIFTKIWPNKKS